MSKVAISIAGFNIYWYSIMIVFGIVASIGIMLKEVKRQNMNREFFLNLAFYIILFGVIGARFYYVLFNLDYYLYDPLEILMIWHGGLAIHGGIFLGLIVVVTYCQKYEARLLKVLDIVVVSVILAQIIGRWGNFFNQEAYGAITSKEALMALKIPNFIINGMYIDGNYYQPTFLYESLWNFMGLIAMLVFRRRKENRIGFITGFYFVWYSLGRFFIETSREDSLMLGSFKVAKLVSVGLLIAGIILMAKALRDKSPDSLYNAEGNDNVRF